MSIIYINKYIILLRFLFVEMYWWHFQINFNLCIDYLLPKLNVTINKSAKKILIKTL